MFYRVRMIIFFSVYVNILVIFDVFNIVGLIILVLVVILLIVLGIIFWRKRNLFGM